MSRCSHDRRLRHRGRGIGGCSIATLLNSEGKEVVLIEKASSLGGCASTFWHRGYGYNAGATTLSGYHEGGDC
jgi:phytoene dehydrogenase-like protein